MEVAHASLIDRIKMSKSEWLVTTSIDGHYVKPDGDTGRMFSIELDYGNNIELLAHVANPNSNKIREAIRWRANLKEQQGDVHILWRSLAGQDSTVYKTRETNHLGPLPTLQRTQELYSPITDLPSSES